MSLVEFLEPFRETISKNFYYLGPFRADDFGCVYLVFRR